MSRLRNEIQYDQEENALLDQEVYAMQAMMIEDAQQRNKDKAKPTEEKGKGMAVLTKMPADLDMYRADETEVDVSSGDHAGDQVRGFCETVDESSGSDGQIARAHGLQQYADLEGGDEGWEHWHESQGQNSSNTNDSAPGMSRRKRDGTGGTSLVWKGKQKMTTQDAEQEREQDNEEVGSEEASRTTKQPSASPAPPVVVPTSLSQLSLQINLTDANQKVLYQSITSPPIRPNLNPPN